MPEATEVATTTGEAPLPSLNTGARAAAREMSGEGRALAEAAKEKRSLAAVIEGLEWGNVKGAALSKATRYALAEFCYITRANPQLHVFVLGGRPYLNADYYADLVNQHPYFVRYEQVDLSTNSIALLRTQTNQVLADLREFGEALGVEAVEDLRREAAALLTRGRELERRRAMYGPDPKATHVYETIIYRYENGAPLAQITSGMVGRELWIKEVRECNWAGGGAGGDPVGNADPGQTARTRSFRRCARFAFSAWMENKEAEIERAERMIEAEFRVVNDDETRVRALLPDSTGQAVRAAGEPAGVNAGGASDLPTYGARASEPQATTTRAAAQPTSEAPAASDTFDRAVWRARHFATLSDAGISREKADREAWYRENGLPASTTTWGEDEYRRADEMLCARERQKYERGCEMLGRDSVEFAHQVLGALPDGLRDLKKLNAELDRLALAEWTGKEVVR